MSTDTLLSQNLILKFPKDFKFGVAVASFQNERSGPRQTDWDDFLKELPEVVKKNEIHPDWWNEEESVKDFDRLKDLNIPTIRMGIEWARVEPEEGKMNEEALNQYRRMLDNLEKRGLDPMITLNHFTLPSWIAKKGGWKNKKTIDAFIKFVALIVTKFSDVTYWVTINEPSILVQAGYMIGYWPPQKHSIFETLVARHNIIKAHKLAYKIIKERLPNSQVGVACHIRWYKPKDPKAIVESFYTEIVNYLDSINWVAATKNHSDFIGINFYTGFYLDFKLSIWEISVREDAVGIPYLLPLGFTVRPDVIPTDAGWPVVPHFFLDSLRHIHKKFGKPMIITENGIADREDHLRAPFILEHLAAIWKVIQEGADIRGYYHWTAVDNLEWREGYDKKFGLIKCDPVTGKRHICHSAYMYSEIANTNTVTLSEMIKKYVPAEKQNKTLKIVNALIDSKPGQIISY